MDKGFVYDQEYLFDFATRLVTPEIATKYQQVVSVLGFGVWGFNTQSRDFDEFMNLAKYMSHRDLYFIPVEALYGFIKYDSVEEIKYINPKDKIYILFLNKKIKLGIKNNDIDAAITTSYSLVGIKNNQ